MIVDHIGYAVKNMDKAIHMFLELGYYFEDVILDEDRNINICFGNNGMQRIELISPIKGKESPVNKILKQNGPTPYHICYIVDDLEKEMNQLAEKHFIIIKEPAPAIAFGSKRVAFLYNSQVGLIEIVEK
ncbi:MAG: hypothetical protein F8N38_04870 [Hungatella sp.]|jgi:methylmalonyl-CoA/ethylmalonyl-CoA epimerase|nr:hypothetical protein [Hungatella sp.]